MNILVLAPQPFFQNRGTPIATRRVLEVLSHSHTIDVLTYHEGADIEIPNCTIHRIPALPFIKQVRPGPSLKKLLCDIAIFASLVRLLRRRRWHVVHAIEESVFMAVLVKLFCGTPFVYDMDSSLSMQTTEKYPVLAPAASIMRSFEKAAISNSAGVIAVCAALRDLAQRLVPGVNIITVEDVSLVEPGGGTPERLENLLQTPGPFVLYVGNLEPYQGIDLLVDAFKQCWEDATAARLVVIGGAPRDLERYRQSVSRQGWSDRIHFLGPRSVERLGSYLSQAAVLVSPRIIGNNTPMKIYSYLESGRPILATRLTTHTQVLDDSIACLVDPEPSAMANGMKTLLTNASLGRELATNARQRAETHYRPEVLNERLSAFYRQLAKTLGVPIGPRLQIPSRGTRNE